MEPSQTLPKPRKPYQTLPNLLLHHTGRGAHHPGGQPGAVVPGKAGSPWQGEGQVALQKYTKFPKPYQTLIDVL